MTWENVSTFMQDYSEAIEIIVFLIGAIGLCVFWYFKNPTMLKNIASGARANISVLSYVKKHPLLWLLATIRTLLFWGVIGILLLNAGLYIVRHAQEPANSIHWPQAIIISFGLLISVSIIVHFITMLLDLMMTYYVQASLENKSIGWRSLVEKAWQSKGVILKFAFLDSVVSLITPKDTDSSRASRPNVLNAILISLASLTWRMATFFIIPVMMEEKDSIVAAIKKSAQTMRNTFGHVIGFNLGNNLFIAVMFIASLVPMVLVLLILVISKELGMSWGEQLLFPLKLSLGFVGLCFIMLSAIVIIMNTIFVAVAYNYAQNKNTGPFDKDFIRNAITTQ